MNDVAQKESILRHAILLRVITGKDIYNSGKYQSRDEKKTGKVELIYHNGNAWPKDLHLHNGDVWQAIREASQDEPLAVWLFGPKGLW